MASKLKFRPDELSKKHRFYYLLWEMACAGFLILWYGNFAYVFATHFYETHEISAFLYLIYELMIVLLLVIRNLPKEISFSPHDWFVAIAGTLGSTLLRPTENSMLPDMDYLIILQLIGLIISAIGLASLAKSYGTVAANRGIKTSGIYRFIRHPLYAGYFLTLCAFVLQHATLYNVIVLAMVLAFKLLRIFAEERLLMQDPEYKAYANKTKARIIPYIW